MPEFSVVHTAAADFEHVYEQVLHAFQPVTLARPDFFLRVLLSGFQVVERYLQFAYFFVICEETYVQIL
jgi:hypothetical protein